ncbi:hypothetical protein [Candidatus Nitrosocosmicus sp. SS]|jgi:hypothetical protein|uniref:hypothetical protein n=1 Tax=Candidatus Nitrosocosmicus agrestis TaxID=2563600 RepID=UPI00122E26AB|nr:hypothetical protein [Candidatus Nitrosocosmicus sp. SS]KAA2283222.1 hypothetical protein F1Z66_03855 [Candidatus Nitrosocosmicus sp. SS]KAF0868678.1 hypothetical protein E5N71_09885 [Candidatus Nitrosocosmicus sp. SS]MDR4489933.1 hypothetical protein [Candidatus Nitrosocosmicus sp.]
MSGDERLSQFLKEGKDWERKPTNVAGVFLFKLPEYRGRPPTIAIEINPLNSNGTPSKKRGIVIKSLEELNSISDLVGNPKVTQLAQSIDNVNPERKTVPKGDTSEVFEI